MINQHWSLMYIDTGKGYHGHAPFLAPSEMSKTMLTLRTQVIEFCLTQWIGLMMGSSHEGSCGGYKCQEEGCDQRK